jgi:redox-sensitive bicupin YhaK (pirin superfamily)
MYSMKKTGNGVYAFVLKGKFLIDGIELDNRDGLGIFETNEFKLESGEDGSEILLMEVPMN